MLVGDGSMAVSYTHLDVYKRQTIKYNIVAMYIILKDIGILEVI